MKKALVLVALALVFTSCAKKNDPAIEKKAEPPTFKVSIQKVKTYIEATGSVQPDLEGSAKILTPLPGAVEKIYVKVGDKVAKGALLVSLRSPDVADVYSNYLSTLTQLNNAERTYNLNKQLFEIGAVMKSDLLNSEAAYQELQAQAEGLKKKLAIYGVSARNGPGDVLLIKAPIAGNVVDIQAHIGDRFDTNTQLLTVADPDKMVVVANLFDTDTGKLLKGDTVSFSTDVFPEKIFSGVITYISDVEDADLKTVKTYIGNLDDFELLKANMFLKIRILTGEQAIPVVPKTALIYKDGKFYVNLKKNGQFEYKEVTPVGEQSEKYMAVKGLNEGDEIVGSAIDMEQP